MHRWQSLLSALLLPLAGLSLLFCFTARPGAGPALLAPADISEARQPNPAADNRTRILVLQCQYNHLEQCRRHLRLARTITEAAQWQRMTRAAVRLYNQVADDTDPSAFALTPLPRHLRE